MLLTTLNVLKTELKKKKKKKENSSFNMSLLLEKKRSRLKSTSVVVNSLVFCFLSSKSFFISFTPKLIPIPWHGNFYGKLRLKETTRKLFFNIRNMDQVRNVLVF